MVAAAVRRFSGLAAVILLLGGCGGTPAQPPADTAEEVAVSPSPVSPPTPAQPPTSGGGYYLDDGPPSENLSAQQLAAIPDAVVRAEKINPAHNRPYVVFGKRYVPFTELRPYRRRGIASWYGSRYHGRKTASGEIYDMHKMTAAHPVLPIPSYVRVTRLATRDSVVVRINDRGPFLQGREIDLSYVAAAKLGIVQTGTGEVEVEVLMPGQQPVPPADDPATGIIEDAVPISDAVYIQLAAFSFSQNADDYLMAAKGSLPANIAALLRVFQKANQLFVVQIGPYSDYAAAAAADTRLCAEYDYCGFLTRRYQ